MTVWDQRRARCQDLLPLLTFEWAENSSVFSMSLILETSNCSLANLPNRGNNRIQMNRKLDKYSNFEHILISHLLLELKFCQKSVQAVKLLTFQSISAEYTVCNKAGRRAENDLPTTFDKGQKIVL